ncbi:MAG: hypothetical protein HW421_3496 [Ignavibacteria bacterium]|nr:hypothetical protein [Ignavibacteria bacterium]
MKLPKILFQFIILFDVQFLFSQWHLFEPEILVKIICYNPDSMEPFMTPDGNAIIFNSLNDTNNYS